MIESVFVVGTCGGAVEHLRFVEPNYPEFPLTCEDDGEIDPDFEEIIDDRYVPPDPYRSPRSALVPM